MTQEEVDRIFAITITIHEDPWFKKKERTREEVQSWVADRLAALGIYTLPVGMSWGSKVSKEHYEQVKSEQYDEFRI